MKSQNYTVLSLGRSVQNRPLEALAFVPQGKAHSDPQLKWILLLGAVHGDEIEGAWLMAELRSRWIKDYPFKKIGVILWEQVNPDGLALAQRCNARQVDLNRNLPTQDWKSIGAAARYSPGPEPLSEPENQALAKLIQETKPIAILSAHSFSRYQVNSNGPARPWSEHVAAVCKYPVTEDIGYPTPGCLGTYSGFEMKIPTITLEIEHLLPRTRVLEIHVPTVTAAIEYWDQ